MSLHNSNQPRPVWFWVMGRDGLIRPSHPNHRTGVLDFTPPLWLLSLMWFLTREEANWYVDLGNRVITNTQEEMWPLDAYCLMPGIETNNKTILSMVGAQISERLTNWILQVNFRYAIKSSYKICVLLLSQIIFFQNPADKFQPRSTVFENYPKCRNWLFQFRHFHHFFSY